MAQDILISGRKISETQIEFFTREILRWFQRNGRRFPWRTKSSTKYQVILAEILLQRTRAEKVAAFLPVFVRHFPSWNALSKVSNAELGKCLKPLGLWRRRAITLSQLSRTMALRNGRFPKDRVEIDRLPGVGQYIANTIELFIHGVPRPLLDANMARILERYFGPRRLADIRYDPYLQKLAIIVVVGIDPISVNWGILDLAALICTPQNPRHDICPLAKKCRFARKLTNGSLEDQKSIVEKRYV